MLFELFPRLKSSGARLVCGARSGDLAGLLAGSPSLWPCPGMLSPSERLSPARTGATVATSPGCWGFGGLVLAIGATAGKKCGSWEVPLLPPPPPPVAMAGAVADCWRGASLSSFGGASEKRLVSSGRLRGPGPWQGPPAFPTSGVRSRARPWELEGVVLCRVWLPVSLPPEASEPPSF